MEQIQPNIDLHAFMKMFKDNPKLLDQINIMHQQNKQLEDAGNERKQRVEEKRKEKDLPIYSKREEIMEQIVENKFSIVVGDTGCGKSTQLPQYLYDYYEGKKDAKILWVLPRKLPAITLAERVCEEMELYLGEEIGFQVPNKSKCNSKTILKFVTDTVLINEIIEKRAKAGPKGKINLNYSIVVLDEVHERNLYTDILLATLKDIALSGHMKLLVTSATINEAVFEEYFDTKAIIVKGRPFPVEIEYNPSLDSQDYLDTTSGSHIPHLARNIMHVVQRMEREDYPYRGHILVFTSGLDDINRLYAMLTDQNSEIDFEKFEVMQLHGLLKPEEQRAVFHDVGLFKVILSTRIAETALTINGVRVVIDVGFDKETNYDSIKRMTIIENKPIPQSSATQRTGRAGRTSPGLCIRLYSEEQFQLFSRNKKPEIQRMDLGKVILKLKAMGVALISDFDFVDKPGEGVIEQTVGHLKEIGALHRFDETLTSIGDAMLQFETDPDFSKVILEGIERDCEDDVIKIIGMIGVNSRLFIRGGEDETKELADKKKLGVCHDKGDLLTLLHVYKKWDQINSKEERREWCRKNMVNSFAISEATRTIRDLNKGLDQAKIILRNHLAAVRNARRRRFNQEQPVLTPEQEKEAHESSIVKCFLSAFYKNVCLYSGIPKLGYTLLRENLTLKLHGASSIALLQDYPEYILCLDVNKTTYNHTKVVSHFKQEWLEELFPGYANHARLNFLTKKFKFQKYEASNVGRIILSKFLDQNNPDIKEIAETTENSFYPDFKEEKLTVYSSVEKIDYVRNKVQQIYYNIQDQLESETREVPITHKTRCVIKSGGEMQELLLGNESISLCFDGFHPKFNEKDIYEVFSKAGEIDTILFTDIDNITKLRFGTIKMKSQQEAKKALQFFTQETLNKFKGENAKIEPKVNLSVFSLRNAAHRAFRVNVEWFTGVATGSASIFFKTPEAAEIVFDKIKTIQPRLRGKEIFNDDVVSNYQVSRLGLLTIRRAVKTKKQLLLRNLDKTIDEFDIEAMLKQYNLDKDFVNAKVYRDSDMSPASPENISHEIYLEIIKQALTDHLGIDESKIYRINAYKPREKDMSNIMDFRETDYKRRVEIDLFDLDLGKKIIDYFDGNDKYGFLTLGKMNCRMSFTRRKALNWYKYRTVQKEIKNLCEKLREEKGNTIRIIEDREPANKNNKNLNVGVRVIAEDQLTLDECCKLIDPILQGIPFYLKTLSQFRKAKLDATKRKVEELESKYAVYIDPDLRRRQLRIIGDLTNREEVFKQLEQYFSVGEAKNPAQVKVDFRFRPVRHILEDDGRKLADIETKFNVRISYSLMKKEIIVKGEIDNVNEAVKDVRKLVNRFEEKDFVSNNECPICYDEMSDGYRLQLCGHKYCYACIEAELNEKLNNDAEFPILCSQCISENEKQVICLRDLSNILAGGKMNVLFERSLEKYLNQNSDLYFRCYSANCPQVFRKSDDPDFSCDYCLKAYCCKCKMNAHGGGLCDDEARNQLIETLKKENKDFRECPSCKSIIEKNEGCNKMHCIRCHTIFCWLCTTPFETEGKVYAHLTEVHGKIGDIDVDNFDDDF